MLQEGSGGPSEGWGPTLSPRGLGLGVMLFWCLLPQMDPRNSGETGEQKK